jgi:ABC-type polysaccharide/polyol phosphate export permease
MRVERVAHSMTLPIPSEGGAPSLGGNIEAGGTTTIPAEPPDHLRYHHHTRLGVSLRQLWESRDIIYTLAERDIRAQYKQATLGLLWALLAPLAMLGIFILIFSRTKSLGIPPGVPYPIFAFIGILCWTFFSQSLGTGGTALLTNQELMAKTQFPRECYPLETILVTAVNTVLGWIPLVLLFVLYRFVPHVQAVWVVPGMIVIEVLFTIGLTLGISALIIQMRDLAQVLPMIIQLGLFVTPVIWEFKLIPEKWRLVYGFFNPLGPVIDDSRRALIQGLNPVPGPLLAAIAGTLCYLAVGYRLFKRFEVNFADIA